MTRPFDALPLSRDKVLTLVANLFFAWVIFQYALGGWETAQLIFAVIGLPAWIALVIVSALVFYHSDYRVDVPLFIAAYALGYWGEWWGTTRGVWTYWNHATPPDYLPPLWAIGLLTVTHLRTLLMSHLHHTQVQALRARSAKQSPSQDLGIASSPNASRLLAITCLIGLPPLAFIISAPNLASVDWSGRLDAHFVAGIIVGIALIAYRFELNETFELYVCGMILGGTYEWLGTSMREWTYITHEVPPLWIIPLWGPSVRGDGETSTNHHASCSGNRASAIKKQEKKNFRFGKHCGLTDRCIICV